MSAPHAARVGLPGALLTVVLLLLFALLSPGYVENPDAEVEFQTARAWVLRGHPGLSADLPDTSAAEVMALRRGHGVMQGRGARYFSWFAPGHALAMTPLYWMGTVVARWFPGPEETVRTQRIAELGRYRGRALGEEFWTHFTVSFLSPVFGALFGLVLFALLGHLGLSTRARVVAVLAGVLTTQFGPTTCQSMSDVMAGALLLASVERAFAWRVESAGRGALVASGLLAGAAVWTRFDAALPVAALALYVVVHARRRRRLGDVLGFVLAGVPLAVGLAALNAWRFGGVFETGYEAGTSGNYWHFPWWMGTVLVGLSPGKGVLWFSPLLWAAPAGLRRLWPRFRGEVAVCAGVLVLPWILGSVMTGWHSSQAWGVRYVAAGAALLTALAVGALWDGRPRPTHAVLVATLALAGLIVNVGGWITPYRAYFGLLLQDRAVADALWPERAPGVDPFLHLVVDPRTTPILGHWRYAGLVLTGRIPDGPGTEVFDVLVGEPVDASAHPPLEEDHGFRHLWPIGLAWRLDSAVPMAVASAMLAALIAGAWMLSRVCRVRAPPRAGLDEGSTRSAVRMPP